jgi:hypothetical protein
VTPSNRRGVCYRMRRLIVLIPILTVAIGGCHEPVGPAGVEIVRFTVMPHTVAPNDSFVVEFTLRNPTMRTLTVTSGASCLFFLQTHRATEPVSITGLSYGCLAMVTTFVVPPLGSLTIVRQAVAAERTGGGSSSPLPAGEYKIQTMMLAPLPDQEAILTVDDPSGAT